MERMVQEITALLYPHIGEAAEERARNIVQAAVDRETPAEEVVRECLEGHFNRYIVDFAIRQQIASVIERA